MEGIVYALAAPAAFNRDGKAFAATGSGLYRSTDGGQTWRSAFESLELTETLSTTCVALSPDFKAEPLVFVGVHGGIMRSLDGGETWQITVLPEPPPLVTAIAMSPNFVEDGVALAATMEDGVFRTGDRGVFWYPWNFGLLDLNVLCLGLSPRFAQDETVFAGTETGLFRSVNGGRAWRETGFPTELAPVLCLAVSPAHRDDGTLYAGTEGHGLYRSSDRGRSWVRVGADVLPDAVNAVILAPDYAARPEVLALAADAVLVSRDGGDAWEPWPGDIEVGEGLSAVAAPAGLGAGAPLLVGRVDGEVARVGQTG